MNPKIVIFTDLDGTLLDHDTYSYEKAEPCLNYLRANNIPLIFTSSKTAVEINELCKKSNLYHPYISENGGLLSIPENYFANDNDTYDKYIQTIIGNTRAEISKVLDPLSVLYKFKSFRDMSSEELIGHTGLDKKQAIYANQRDCTEPLLWLDENSKLSAFEKELTKNNLRLISGGRFHHVMGQHDKATTMSLLIEQFEKFYSQKTTSIALGDSPNDLKMIANANHGILIPNPHAPKMCVNNHASLNYAEKPGPQGWNDTLLALLKELTE